MPPIHEAAELFPLLEGSAFDDLVADIERHGLREPIMRTSDGKILDGRNRYRACLAAGRDPIFKTFRGPGTAVQYVISANLHRRHLTTSQRSMIAAKIASLPQGARTDLAENSAMSQPEAAEALKVSRGSVQNAKQVLDRGTPELVDAVRDGAISVGAAVEATALEPEAQRDVVRQVKKGTKASTAVAEKKTKTPTPKRPPRPAPDLNTLMVEWTRVVTELSLQIRAAINDPVFVELAPRIADHFRAALTGVSEVAEKLLTRAPTRPIGQGQSSAAAARQVRMVRKKATT
jgi:ParB-like chromosome segregation protein Spo0J